MRCLSYKVGICTCAPAAAIVSDLFRSVFVCVFFAVLVQLQ